MRVNTFNTKSNFNMIKNYGQYRLNLRLILFNVTGHGFKLAPVVGKVLAEMATNKAPSYDMTPFKIQRFRQNAKL